MKTSEFDQIYKAMIAELEGSCREQGGDFNRRRQIVSETYQRLVGSAINGPDIGGMDILNGYFFRGFEYLKINEPAGDKFERQITELGILVEFGETVRRRRF